MVRYSSMDNLERSRTFVNEPQENKAKKRKSNETLVQSDSSDYDQDYDEDIDNDENVNENVLNNKRQRLQKFESFASGVSII